MELKKAIDAQIQHHLKRAGIEYQTDKDGKIHIKEYRLDKQAKAGMLYLEYSALVPSGALPFLVLEADSVLGVFHLNKRALILEVSSASIDGEIYDYYEKHS